ncbi:MerR family DNA-binding protein [Streptomyces panacea]|uniref:MerR family DNA-binding protein n=1 Tax=Streptomyces panacea TaxID=3035064 RepID=UPI00339BCECA
MAATGQSPGTGLDLRVAPKVCGRRYARDADLPACRTHRSSGDHAAVLRDAGPLPADRTASGCRVYGEKAVERLAFIGAAKHLGLPLEEIAELLDVWQSGACREVKAGLRPRIAARLTAAEERTAELPAFRTTLRSALDHLDALPDRAEPCDPQHDFLTDGTAPSKPRPGPVEVALVHVRRAAEQNCCPFFDSCLHLDGPELHLEVRAPAEAAGQLAELFTDPR